MVASPDRISQEYDPVYDFLYLLSTAEIEDYSTDAHHLRAETKEITMPTPENAAQRTARCACGALRITVTGEPLSVVACHCIDCQRRTGSVFGVGAYFREEQVAKSGDARIYTRPTEAGHDFVTYF